MKAANVQCWKCRSWVRVENGSPQHCPNCSRPLDAVAQSSVPHAEKNTPKPGNVVTT